MTKDKRTGWLARLKVGDEVIKSASGIYGREAVLVIEKITPTGIIKTNKGLVFDHVGRIRGASTFERLLEPTAEAIQRVKDAEEKKEILYKVNDQIIKNLNVDQLRRILAIIEEG